MKGVKRVSGVHKHAARRGHKFKVVGNTPLVIGQTYPTVSISRAAPRFRKSNFDVSRMAIPNPIDNN